VVSIPHTHIAIGAPPLTVWTLTLDRAGVAALIAEIEARVLTESLRPELHAQIAGDTATLYVLDHACLADVLGLLLDHRAGTVPELPTDLTLSGRGVIRFWANKPGKDGAQPLDLALGICRCCQGVIREPAPGAAGKRQCKDCWRQAISAGRQKQIAADVAFLERHVGREAA
jgi:hypothetical protein